MAAYDWAVSFEKNAREPLLGGDYTSLVNYERLGRDALLSIPTPDHYLPLLYVIGAAAERERITFPVEGVDGASISMLAVQVGDANSANAEFPRLATSPDGPRTVI